MNTWVTQIRELGELREAGLLTKRSLRNRKPSFSHQRQTLMRPSQRSSTTPSLRDSFRPNMTKCRPSLMLGPLP